MTVVIDELRPGRLLEVFVFSALVYDDWSIAKAAIGMC